MSEQELYFEAVCDLIEALYRARQAGNCNDLLDVLLQSMELQLDAQVVVVNSD